MQWEDPQLLAAVVIKEGEESHTTNLCQQCYNKSLKAKGDKQLTKWQWYDFLWRERPIVEGSGK